MDAWIEIKTAVFCNPYRSVASFMDAWIEMFILLRFSRSHLVASFMDAWIEIIFGDSVEEKRRRRILYGCVD